MGNLFGLPWSASYSEERNEVVVNLKRLRANLPFNFQTLNGSVTLPFNLGRQAIRLGDVLQLARKDIPVMARLEVHSQRKIVLSASAVIERATVDRLATGVSQPILKEITSWQRVKRIDTDSGIVVVEVRLVPDVSGILKLGVAPVGWFGGVQRILLAEAEGSVEIYVRARFERQDEHLNRKIVAGAATVIAAVPFVLYAVVNILMFLYLTS